MSSRCEVYYLVDTVVIDADAARRALAAVADIPRLLEASSYPARDRRLS